jgi:hypothetical protein
MVSNASTEYDPEFLEFAEQQLATGEQLNPEIFPQLYNLSAGFIFRFVYRPTSITCPEFVYVPFEIHGTELDEEHWAKYELLVCQWNYLWETSQLRYEFFQDDLPAQLSWLTKFSNSNLYLLPHTEKTRYDAYIPLFHLLPQRTLQKYRLPMLRRGIWPSIGYTHHAVPLLQADFEDRLSNAFAHHVWPLLSPGSRTEAFSKDDTIVLLSHNLDYWLPFAYSVAEERLRSFPRVPCESTEQESELKALQQTLPSDIQVDRPLCGGHIWAGETDAWDATKELVEVADRNGKLRGIIEAIRSNRVEEDFSDRWSYAREDFERKLYSKRSKVKVSFVQLDDTIPIHGPYSELDENLLWEDFIGLLDKKERQVVVCLRSGETKVGEISKILGYANHSPVSKALKRIRQKAKQYFELD